jgi:hypothetical protein
VRQAVRAVVEAFGGRRRVAAQIAARRRRLAQSAEAFAREYLAELLDDLGYQAWRQTIEALGSPRDRYYASPMVTMAREWREDYEQLKAEDECAAGVIAWHGSIDEMLVCRRDRNLERRVTRAGGPRR